MAGRPPAKAVEWSGGRLSPSRCFYLAKEQIRHRAPEAPAGPTKSGTSFYWALASRTLS